MIFLTKIDGKCEALFSEGNTIICMFYQQFKKLWKESHYESESEGILKSLNMPMVFPLTTILISLNNFSYNHVVSHAGSLKDILKMLRLKT